MAKFVIMPRQGQSVDSCIITKWHKKVQEAVKIGDLLFSYETDKSSFDEEATFDGVLLKILHDVDDDVPCLDNVCIIGDIGEDISTISSNSDEKKEIVEEIKPTESKKAQSENISNTTAQINVPLTGDIHISPRAKGLAEKLKVDFSLATPTGAEGRIIERDIEKLVANGIMAARKTELVSKPSEVSKASDLPEYIDEKIPNIRKVIARAMQNSLTTTAQLTLNSSFDASDIMKFRAAIKPLAEKGEAANITLNDMVMYVVARVLLKHREVNANLIDTSMRYFNTVNLGMAVDTSRGLLVPILRGAEKLSLSAMSVELKKLAKDTQAGTIKPDLLSGGSFTVTNLGTLGVESFTPVINAPQTAILGVCAVVDKVKSINGQIATYPAMGLSLTFDHRALDGAPAAKFLQDVARGLASFATMLAIDNI